jgi:hypothetical protein
MDSWNGFVDSVVGRLETEGLVSIFIHRFDPDIQITECIPKIFICLIFF